MLPLPCCKVVIFQRKVRAFPVSVNNIDIKACCLLPKAEYSSGSEGGFNDDVAGNLRFFTLAGVALVGVSEDEPVIQSQFSNCNNNHAPEPLVVENASQTTYLYTRDGPVKTQHISKKCKICKTRYFHGFKYVDRTRVYDHDVLSRSHLVTGSHTAFSVKQLHEWVLLILRGNVSMSALSEVYNDFHRSDRTEGSEDARFKLWEERLSEAFFLYSFLEFSQRAGIKTEFKFKEDGGDSMKWIDRALESYHFRLRDFFRIYWTSQHKCETEGCMWAFVSDGGMKIHRKLCAAKFSGVRELKHSNVKVLTGCTKIAPPNSLFCKIHQNQPTPVIPSANVSKKTKESLAQSRKKSQKTGQQLSNDNLFIVESVLKFRLSKTKADNKSSGKRRSSIVPPQREFLIKWASFDEKEATWEPAKNIPVFLQKFYLKSENLGKPLPQPHIKHTKTFKTGEKVHLLCWGDGKHSEEWVADSLFDLDNDSMIPQNSLCNTRKIKDKRIKHRSAGIFISATSCGVIPHFDEIYGCESISQNYASKIEFLGNLPEEVRDKIRVWFFDDMCHEKPFSEEEARANFSESTKFFAEKVEKAVDFFHFPGHTSKWCFANTNPWELQKKMGFVKLNTPACEQAFNWLNRFKNVKGMNEARFAHFFLYMIDLHNFKIEDRMCVVNPFLSAREKHIEATTQAMSKYRNLFCPENEISPQIPGHNSLDELNATMANLNLGKTFILNDLDHCEICKVPYKNKGPLKNHLITKHGVLESSVFFWCETCARKIDDQKQFTRHMKSH